MGIRASAKEFDLRVGLIRGFNSPRREGFLLLTVGTKLRLKVAEQTKDLVHGLLQGGRLK